MNPRSSNIIIYKHKDQQVDKNFYCRICIGNRIGESSPDICWDLSDKQCCSYIHGGINNGPCTRNFHFNNIQHVPILTTTECKICSDKTCKVTTDTMCHRTNIFHIVLTYLQNIKRVGIENIEELQ